MITWRVECGDALELLKAMPAGSVDAVVTDPPWGIDLDTNFSKQTNQNTHAKVIGDADKFDPFPWTGFRRVVLWGANNFASRLPDMGGWLVWDKVTRNGFNMRISEHELAWTNCVRRGQAFRHMWSGAFRDSERGTAYHPCQKPVALFRWCLDVASIPVGATVLDPYCGSGPVGVACIQTGRSFIGFEIDPGYAAVARRRCAEAVPSLFVPPQPAPPGLFPSLP